jgi:AcrR family transcriptional regulator
MRTQPEEMRRVIVKAALLTFCERGYGPATLEEIGAKVSLTRGGVLHHFKSKAVLLEAVIEPFREALTDLLLHIQLDDPPSRGQRRQLLGSLADLMLEYRGSLRLLANDVSARAQLDRNGQWPLTEGRLIGLLLGSKGTDLTQVQVAAALGALIQPVASLWLDLDGATTRGQLVDAAAAVLDGPRSAPAHPRAQGGAVPSMLGPLPLASAVLQ